MDAVLRELCAVSFFAESYASLAVNNIFCVQPWPGK